MCFSHYLRLPTAYLDQQQSGHLLSKLTNNIELVAAAATSAAIELMSDSLTILALLIYLFLYELAPRAVLHRPCPRHRLADENRETARFRRYSERIQNSMGDITRVAKEAIDAHRLIKIFNAEDHQTKTIRAGQRAQPSLEYEIGARQSDQQPGRAVHCCDRARQRALRVDTSGVFR